MCVCVCVSWSKQQCILIHSCRISSSGWDNMWQVMWSGFTSTFEEIFTPRAMTNTQIHTRTHIRCEQLEFAWCISGWICPRAIRTLSLDQTVQVHWYLLPTYFYILPDFFLTPGYVFQQKNNLSFIFLGLFIRTVILNLRSELTWGFYCWDLVQFHSQHVGVTWPCWSHTGRWKTNGTEKGREKNADT